MALTKKYYTPEEYLELERKAEYKSEYIDGQIYPMGEIRQEGNNVYSMAGASEEHNLIAGNVFGEVRAQLKGGHCRAYINDMRVKVNPTGIYTYPAVVAVCGQRKFQDDHTDTLTNPTVIVEVLSPSTEAYDRGLKFAHYQGLESRTDYALIAQERMRVEHYRREGETSQRWILTVITEANDILHLDSIECHLPLSEIYEEVEFA